MSRAAQATRRPALLRLPRPCGPPRWWRHCGAARRVQPVELRHQRAHHASATMRGSDSVIGPTPSTSSVSIEIVSAEFSSPPIDWMIRETAMPYQVALALDDAIAARRTPRSILALTSSSSGRPIWRASLSTVMPRRRRPTSRAPRNRHVRRAHRRARTWARPRSERQAALESARYRGSCRNRSPARAAGGDARRHLGHDIDRVGRDHQNRAGAAAICGTTSWNTAALRSSSSRRVSPGR